MKKIEYLISDFGCGYRVKDEKVVPSKRLVRHTNVREVSERIKGGSLKDATEAVQAIEEKALRDEEKLLRLPMVTFNGTFKSREGKSLLAMSPYLVLDYDASDIIKAFPNCDIEKELERMKKEIISDRNFDIALVFRSPSGKGIKPVFYVGDRQGLDNRDAFKAVDAYFAHKLGVHSDPHCSDVARGCILAHDPDCYINPKLDSLKSPRISLKTWLPKPKMYDHNSCSELLHKGKFNDVYHFVEAMVSRHVTYAPGSHNAYVSRVGYMLCNYGIPLQEAMRWGTTRFSDYKDTKSVFLSCYRNGNFGEKEFRV